VLKPCGLWCSVVKASVQLFVVIIALVVIRWLLSSLLNNADHFGLAGGGVRTHPSHPPGYGPVHWLKVSERIQFLSCVLVYRCLHGSAACATVRCCDSIFWRPMVNYVVSGLDLYVYTTPVVNNLTQWVIEHFRWPGAGIHCRRLPKQRRRMPRSGVSTRDENAAVHITGQDCAALTFTAQCNYRQRHSDTTYCILRRCHINLHTRDNTLCPNKYTWLRLRR